MSDLIRRTQLTERDVFIDLGSGLGHVSLLASMCAGTRCIGIEVVAAYVNCARQNGYELNLNNIDSRPDHRISLSVLRSLRRLLALLQLRGGLALLLVGKRHIR
jgi:hypothetical protein